MKLPVLTELTNLLKKVAAIVDEEIPKILVSESPCNKDKASIAFVGSIVHHMLWALETDDSAVRANALREMSELINDNARKRLGIK